MAHTKSTGPRGATARQHKKQTKSNSHVPAVHSDTVQAEDMKLSVEEPVDDSDWNFFNLQ